MRTPIQDTAWLEFFYIALAVVGLAATNAQILAYLGYGFVNGNVNFWKETVATPASTFILVDIFVLGAAVLTFLFAECRRVGISSGYAWMYFLGSSFIGICVFVPLFLAHRNRRIRVTRPDQQSAPSGLDFIAIAIAVSSVIVVASYSVTHLPHS